MEHKPERLSLSKKTRQSFLSSIIKIMESLPPGVDQSQAPLPTTKHKISAMTWFITLIVGVVSNLIFATEVVPITLVSFENMAIIFALMVLISTASIFHILVLVLYFFKDRKARILVKWWSLLTTILSLFSVAFTISPEIPLAIHPQGIFIATLWFITFILFGTTMLLDYWRRDRIYSEDRIRKLAKRST